MYETDEPYYGLPIVNSGYQIITRLISSSSPLKAFMTPLITALRRQLRRQNHHHLQQFQRTFVNAKVKWVQDPCLDFVVKKEKNLKPILSLKTLIQSSPSKSIPITTVSAHKHHHLRLPSTTTTSTFLHTYPSLFQQFFPTPFSIPRVRLTQRALVLYSEETAIYESRIHRDEAAGRLIKLLMLTGGMRLPLRVVDMLKFDLGIQSNYILGFLSDYPDSFHVCKVDGFDEFCLELVKWRDDLAVSIIEKEANCGFKKGMRLKFPIQMPKGFDYDKRVQNWYDEFQNLPYISPYENAFHLNPFSDIAEKWTVAVLHEFLHLLISKKTEKENVYALFQTLGFNELRLRHALRHHPGIFYISNKIRTQTVVLREGYDKDFLIEKHPLMGMRYRYIHLMNKSLEKRKRVDIHYLNKKRKQPNKLSKSTPLSDQTSEGRDDQRREHEKIEGSSDFEVEDYEYDYDYDDNAEIGT